MKILSYRLFLLIFLMIAPLCFGGRTSYAETVKIRGGDHAGYSRLVIEWSSKVVYEINDRAASLSVTFDKNADIDTSAVNAQSLRNIGTVNVSSPEGQPLKLDINKASGAKIRDFRIGKRVVIDVYDGGGEVSSIAPTSVPTSAARTSESIETKQAAPAPAVENLTFAGVQPHVITISTTKNIGVSVFERLGYLWIVMDDPEIRVRPVLAGPQKEDFPDFEEISMGGGKAYRMQLPVGMETNKKSALEKPSLGGLDGYKIYAEGGGLLWRIIVTPNPRRVISVKPEVKETSIAGESGYNLLWPLTSVRKVLSLIDPMVGDEIRIVTVEDSSQYGGEARQFVEVETLNSIVGLAALPKADDIRMAQSSDGVLVTRPGGLAVSSKSDTAALILKDDVQKEEEELGAEEKQKRLSRIFDFERWEMGGIYALEENRRVIMVGMGPKEGHAKVEDLMTLAKLNIANNRGAEALGLLRVAMQELPGIEEGAEFVALRGAAGALAGQSDLAIEDLASPSIQQYDEVGYWKAYGLAQLEDWRQADSVMPKDFDLLFEYPHQIRNPLALSMAEIALRSAKIDVAQALLVSLEPGLDQMEPSQKAAWKYLSGELARQMKEDDRAFELWKELVDKGDDYYRAKAGLSLTRLQLERQKITPEKAIDRLEGLRYAWRGDELETLINFRLGEVYLQNGDYLKGLGTLRNAISLSPDSIMAQEVTEYMTGTFRDLFSSDKLKEVSPLDAVSIYDEFKELTPIGEEGDVFVQQLAERLVDVDLLGRASTLLEHQINHRLSDKNKIPVAIRLAAIRLLDDKPEGGVAFFGYSTKANSKRPEEMLRSSVKLTFFARVRYPRTDQVDDALDILDKMGSDLDVARLKADIAWGGKKWADAATAFQDIISDENISLTRPLTEYQANLILNRSIALNLAGNRLALTNLRERYGDLMLQTEKSRLFDLVTRPRQLGLLGSRDSVSSLISEVDMFGEFLDNYRKMK